MKLARTLTFAAVSAAAVLGTAAPAEASPQRCEVVAQPWDGRSYAFAAVVDGAPRPLITRQSGLLDGQTAWEFDAGSLTEVWWAAKDPARQASAADFYDVLPVGPDCRFTVAYHANPGHQDSVIIRPVATPPTSTSTTAPEPTITFATTPAPSTTVAPPAVTTTTSTAVDVPPSAAPTTTTPAPTLPPVPASSTTSPVELFTATSVEQTATALPATGNRPLRAGLGVLFIAGGLGLWFLSLRPLRRRTIKENQPS